ncbi:MAG: ATP-binding protein [Candidatus Omnitrophica bacterium]|nr:ATP-binding protein [Candidatus Omnitrophota bacterium]
MYIPRQIDVYDCLKQKSLFLLGPRQTGKSCLISNTLSEFRVYDLLDNEVFLNFSREPKRLEQEIEPNKKIIIIDEIQKLPFLLDEVHRIIEKYGIHFLLTGSSARKLRRGGVNLLGGRARSKSLHPFIFTELKKKFNLLKALNYGLIPSIYFSDSPEEDLKGYSGSYLKEEIAAEGLTRNVPAFSRFLQVAAFCNGQMINYTNIANDAQVPVSTVQEYFQILRDTLIGFDVPAWKKSQKRKPISTSKFYFFDVGVVRYLQNRSVLKEKSPEFGDAFETYLAHELKTYVDYNSLRELYYWRSKSGYETDFVIEDILAVEVKAKSNISASDLRGILALKEEGKFANYVVVSLEKYPRTVKGIQILPWKGFLTRLWGNAFNRPIRSRKTSSNPPKI